MVKMFFKDKKTGEFGYYYEFTGKAPVNGISLRDGREMQLNDVEAINIEKEIFRLLYQMQKEIAELRKRLDNKHFENKF